MKSRGLGDSIANFTKKTGIKAAVQKIASGLNKPLWLSKKTRLFK